MSLDKNTARVVVIGGGVVGCSILYHLTKAGWTDVVLLERQELTSGSSWHAAGSLFTLTTPFNASFLQKYAFELYPELERESGQSCGFHKTGELWLATSDEEYKSHKVIRAQGLRNGIHAEFISLQEAEDRLPILNTDKLTAVMFEQEAGFCDPASVTNAFAITARNLGATICRHTPVIETNLLETGEWQVVTATETINCEYLVNAAGLWGREVAALAGITLPLVPVQHHYLVTEEISEIAQMESKVPSLAINEANLYARQEGDGLLLGAYESNCHFWSEHNTPSDFGHELLPNDLERIEDNFSIALKRMPCLEKTGIKNVINGPMIFSPDLGPLIGPHPKLRNYFCANGVMTGFNQGPGIGKALAQWIIDDDPDMDMSFWHVGRFGEYADHQYTKARAKYFYEHRSQFVYPHQDFDAGRPVRQRPIYNLQKQSGAVFAEYCGWEDPVYFARNKSEQSPEYSFEIGSWSDVVKGEVLAVHNDLGLFDFSSFAKYLVEGQDAFDWLNYLCAGRVPKRVGNIQLCPMLNHNGKLIADLTLTKLSEDKYLLIGSGSMQHIHMGWFKEKLADTDLSIKNISDDFGGLHIAGPKAESLLSQVVGQKITIENFPFLASKIQQIGACEDVIVLRLSFTGESGFELYMPKQHQLSVYKALIKAGEALGLKQAGSHALMSMRLEKSFPSWGLELSSDYQPCQCGLQRFIDLDKNDFIGRKAFLSFAKTTPPERLVTLEIDAQDREAFGGEPIFLEDQLAGYITSGGYGYRVNKNLALGYLAGDFLSGQEFEIEMIGERFPVRVLPRSPFDPDNIRLRA